MKILLLSASLDVGGIETGTIDLARSLKKLGQEIIVVSSGGQLVKELEDSRIRHIQLPVHKKSLSIFFQTAKLIKIIKEENIDIVHAQSRMPAWAAYSACRRTKTAFITSCHGYYSKHFFSNIMAKGEKVIVISEIIGRHMEKSFKVPKERIRLVYRGVDLSRYQYSLDRFKHPKDKIRIVNIARITPIKGQLEFIQAINKVAKQLSNIEVYLVGTADKKKRNYETNLIRLVKELNLEDKVKFLGRREDVPEILIDADILVLSTNMPEAFGRVIIEAGASGVAVCATKIGGIEEIIEDGKDGVLFSCGDVNSMADAIMRLLRDANLRQQISKNLRKKVEEKFSLERMTTETQRVYQEALEEKNMLVIKLGGLGDLILATPSLRVLRKHFPKARISLLINSNFKSIMDNCPYVDNLILYDHNKTTILELIKQLKEKKFGLSIDFKNNSFTHLISFLAKIPNRYGFSRGINRFMLNHPEPLPKNLVEKPVAQQFRILKRLGISSFDESLQLWNNKQDDDYIDNILDENGISGLDALIGLVINASKEWPTKNWPIENFIRLSKMLSEKGLKVVLIGDSYSKEKADKFAKDINVIDFTGKTNLNQLVSLIKRLNILITPDSAPMHIAGAVGTKIIAMFGPTDPKRHIPPTDTIDVLVRNIDCQPCYKRKCINKENMACLNQIKPEEVFNTIIKQID